VPGQFFQDFYRSCHGSQTGCNGIEKNPIKNSLHDLGIHIKALLHLKAGDIFKPDRTVAVVLTGQADKGLGSVRHDPVKIKP
jgi:hypothetical protein